jgi:hypothetical protein
LDIVEGLEQLRVPLRSREWEALERIARDECAAADRGISESIAEADLTAFEALLESSLRALSIRAAEEGAAAVYWEFDPDNEWNSAFFLCASYEREEAESDDWAADFDEDAVEIGPSVPEFVAVYDPAWDGSDRAEAGNLYLIARTLTAFGRAAERAWSADLPLCAGYHDQEVVFRDFEPA